MITRERRASRDVRHLRLRRRLRGSAARPRLAVFRSLNHIYAQLIDDESGRTLAAVDSRSPAFRARQKSGGKRVVFDRGGFQYHGRVKALAEAARAGGLVF